MSYFPFINVPNENIFNNFSSDSNFHYMDASQVTIVPSFPYNCLLQNDLIGIYTNIEPSLITQQNNRHSIDPPNGVDYIQGYCTFHTQELCTLLLKFELSFQPLWCNLSGNPYHIDT